jgi:hypothetical protein
LRGWASGLLIGTLLILLLPVLHALLNPFLLAFLLLLLLALLLLLLLLLTLLVFEGGRGTHELLDLKIQSFQGLLVQLAGGGNPLLLLELPDGLLGHRSHDAIDGTGADALRLQGLLQFPHLIGAQLIGGDLLSLLPLLSLLVLLAHGFTLLLLLGLLLTLLFLLSGHARLLLALLLLLSAHARLLLTAGPLLGKCRAGKKSENKCGSNEKGKGLHFW